MVQQKNDRSEVLNTTNESSREEHILNHKDQVNLDEYDVSSLTDADILKMDEKDYMSPLQLAYFKHKLLMEEESVLDKTGEFVEVLEQQDTVYLPDISDKATVEQELTLVRRSLNRGCNLLHKVHNALKKIDERSYGFCEETGEPIGLKRLLARPTATLSIDAQERKEKSQKHYAED